ncbi:MAG: hypothetical protein ACI8Q6_004012 [Granulosicoccus sp.]|jgi:hypothetical protein
MGCEDNKLIQRAFIQANRTGIVFASQITIAPNYILISPARSMLRGAVA